MNNKNIKLSLYHKTIEVMALQADLKWILNELKDVEDPALIEAFKNMLKYRKKVKSNLLSEEQKREEILMNEAEADIKAGRTYSIKESRKIIDSWEL
mgnify:CR=1 FL=1